MPSGRAIIAEGRIVTVVYVDILLFVNTIINFTILVTAGRIMKRKTMTWRLIISSFTGSLFSLLIFVGGRSFFFSLLIKVISTVTITLIAYGYDTYKELLKTGTAVIITSTVFSGLMIALYQLCRPPNMLIVNDIVYFEINPIVLVVTTGVIYAILYIIEKLFRERIRSTVVRLSFTVNGKNYTCPGKIDTGCNLTEPFSGSAVIIADKSLFSLPEQDGRRVIPYSTVGGSSILYGIKADRITINDQVIRREIYIASGDIQNNSYRAIINSEILR